LLGSIALNIPIVVGGALLMGLALVLALVMPETGFKPTPRENRTSFQQMVYTFRADASIVRQRRVLLALMVAAAFFGAFSEGFGCLWIPHLIQFTPPYFEPIAWIGIINAASLGLGILAAEFVKRRVNTNNPAVVARALRMILALIMAFMVMYGLAWNFGVALLAVLALTPLRGMNYPLATAWLNQHVDSAVRATVFSMRNQADACGQMLGGPVLGAIATLASLRVEMIVAALFLAPALYVYARHGVTPEKSEIGEFAQIAE
jgi:DHA3 family tetracycline resistance protein-like MFS transporter